MVKPLLSLIRLFFVITLFLGFTIKNQVVFAQCGVSAFNEGGTLTPTSSWQNVTGGVGSGTYVDFNVTPGKIYSFRYATSTVLGYNWDMTVSNSGVAIPYNSSLTPINDSWTGGIGCPNSSRPTSAEWYSTYTGTFTVSTNLWNGGCNAFVPGVGSAILQYKECVPSPDPGSGSNQWTVDAFATTDIAIPNLDARYGYYTDGSLNFSTTAAWSGNGRPSDAAGWIGCEVPNDNFTIRARRTGFPCAYYNINVNNADDNIRIFVNGNQIYDAPCCVNSTTLAASYVLGPSDNVEIRLVGVCGSDLTDVSFVAQPNPVLSGGTIGGVQNGSVICEGPFTLNFTNAVSASGGVAGLTNGGSVVYDWEISKNGGLTYNSTGVSTATWTLNDTLLAGDVFVIRRKASDKCGNVAYSNTITLIGKALPNGSMLPSNQTICPGTTAVITLNFPSGAAPFNFTFTDGVSNYTRTGLHNGDTIQVKPALNTVYSFVSIVDSFGCSRTSGFLGGALVQVLPDINITGVNVANPSCFGGGNGTITISANGGVSYLTYSIDGGATTQFSNVFNGLIAGSYNVAVIDSYGCSKSYVGNPVIMGQPTVITHTSSNTSASCANVFDGTVTINASGGTPPYSYSLNGGPTQPGSTFTGLGANTYNITVFDNNGCTSLSSTTITNTYIISVDTLSKTDVSCFGFTDGAVTVQVNGGIPPYTYSINGITFQSSGTFTGLNAGSFIITGRDSKGCTEFVTVNISQPNPVTITVDSLSNLLCFGSSTGGIYITASGGTAPYTYNWNNSTTLEDLTGVAGGTYNVTVTDSKGCSAAGGATIAQPLELFLNIASFSNLLCVGDSTGAIDLTANGGVPPYTYAWSNGTSTEDISHLAAATHSVTVTDANGCQKNISQVISEPTQLISSITGTDVTCSGLANGSADLTVNGGTSPYYFQWSTFQASEDITGLSGGLYYVIITDNNGCQQRDSVIINEPLPFTLTTTINPVSCFNTNDGAIDLTVSGGSSPFIYQWSNGASSQDLNNLSGGNYCVSVTDNNLCSATFCTFLSTPTVVSSNFIVKNTLCYGDSNGVVDLIPSGGLPPYTFNWSNAATSEDLLGVAAGTYYITISDTKNCTRIDSATVSEPAAIVTSGFITNVTCYGYTDGAVDITAYGGTLPYAYSWSTGESTEDIISLTGGNYYVTVTDANGCVAATLYPVNEPAVLGLTLVGTNVSCYGENNGAVAAIPSGGRTPYEYLWNNFSLDSSQAGLTAGAYVVILTDSSGCHISSNITLTQPAEINITGTVTDAACNGTATGAIDITVTGGITGYIYIWNNSATTEDISNIVAGAYTVTVTDGNSCNKSASFTVGQAVALFTNVSLSNPICFGGSNGFISVAVTGGSIPYNYTWNTTPVQTGATATNLKAGTYILTVTDAGNCSASVTASLTEPTPIDVTVNGIDAKCYNTATGSITATVSGGTPPYVYNLNGITQPSDSFGNLMPGAYVISVRDVNGCEGVKTFVINSPSAVTVDLTAPQATILAGMTTQLVANTNSSSQIVNYVWQPLDSVLFDFSNCADEANCFNPYVQPFYTTLFTVTVMNADSCFASDTVSVIVENAPAFFIPNTFTPNDDGLNDYFAFDILGATKIDVGIYSRWGERVFYNPNQTNGLGSTDGWNGKKDGKALSEDTYVYKLKITYFDGVVRDKTGTVTIIR